MKNGTEWTPQENQRLRDLWQRPLSCVDIGKMLCAEFGTPRNKNAVIGRAKRLGLGGKQSIKVGTLPEPPPPLKPGDTCQWIFGHPTPGVEVEYCGKGVQHGNTPYCRAHTRRAYEIPPKPPQEEI